MNRKDPELGLCLLFERWVNSTQPAESLRGRSPLSQQMWWDGHRICWSLCKSTSLWCRGPTYSTKERKPRSLAAHACPCPTPFMRAGMRTRSTVMFICAGAKCGLIQLVMLHNFSIPRNYATIKPSAQTEIFRARMKQTWVHRIIKMDEW